MNLKDLASAIDFKQLSKFSKFDKDDLLENIGLQTKQDNLLPGLLVFGAGIAVGVGIGMLLAPRSGEELRSQLGESFNKGLESGKSQVDQIKSKVAATPIINGGNA
jgi:hypothetical protein